MFAKEATVREKEKSRFYRRTATRDESQGLTDRQTDCSSVASLTGLKGRQKKESLCLCPTKFTYNCVPPRICVRNCCQSVFMIICGRLCILCPPCITETLRSNPHFPENSIHQIKMKPCCMLDDDDKSRFAKNRK